MATTTFTGTGNGTNKLFTFPFDYLDTADIDVYVNGTLTTLFTFAGIKTIEFATAPANGAEVLIKRTTNDATKAATFFPGSSVKATDLNTNFDQVLYLAQETANEAANQNTAGLQAQVDALAITANTAYTTAVTANDTANAISGTASTALTNANAATVTANAATVTANAALPKAGGAMTGVIVYNAAQPRLVSGTVINVSGTSVDFSGIPIWAKRVTVTFKSLSTNSTNIIQCQLGSLSPVTTGYVGALHRSGSQFYNITTGLGLVPATGAISNNTGSAVFTLLTGNIWVGTCTALGEVASSGFFLSSTSVTLPGTLDSLRLIGSSTGAPSDTFDNGSVNILYEG
jgi:hypothetical protein